MHRYEYGDEWLSAGDVQEELEDLIDYEPYDEDLTPKLQEALREYVLAQYECERCGGRAPDGGDEFIARIEEIIGFEE